MKICDVCAVKNDDNHNSVGGVRLSLGGYHYSHWSHKGKPNCWDMELCPKCTGDLKDILNINIKSFLKRD